MAKRYRLTNPLQVARNVPKLDDSFIKSDDNNIKHEIKTPESRRIVATANEVPVFVPSDDPDIQRAISLRRQYLRDTGVNGHMNKLTADLLRSNKLPYNPYPGYIKRFTKISERFHTRRKSLAEIHQHLSQDSTDVTKTGSLSRIKSDNSSSWGLQHILMIINPKMLSMLGDIVKGSIIQQKKLSPVVKNASLMSCMTGPCIFLGSFHDSCYRLNVVVNVLVTASNSQDAAFIFAETVVADLNFVLKETDHQILSVDVYVLENDKLNKKSWYVSDLEELLISNSDKHDSLVKAVAFAATKKQDCTVKLILNCGKHSLSLKMKNASVLKSYRMMAVLSSAKIDGRSGQNIDYFYKTAPYESLHDGIFMDQSEAELYLSTFKNAGFKSPLQSNVITAIQKSWQQRIVGCQMESNMMEISQCGILLERTQNLVKPISSRKEDSLAIEMYRICQGLGLKLERISTLVMTMSDILESELKDSELFLVTLDQYKDCLDEFFDETFHDTTVAYAKRRLLDIVNSIATTASSRAVDKMKRLLHYAEAYMKSLSIGLIDDAVDGFPTIHQTLSQIDSLHNVQFGRDLHTDVSTDKYRHKSEAESAGDVERKIVDMSISAAATHSSDAPQAARLQYLMDVRVDEVWERFLHDIFMSRKNPPPNPSPLLISRLREGSLKVQLHREDNAAISRKFITAKPKIYDLDLKLYTISGASAFGCFAAISSINSIGFKQTSTIALNTAILSPSHATGMNPSSGDFDFKFLSALSGECLMLNSFSPYLTSVSTEEHCLITGPEEQEIDGLSTLSSLLLEYLDHMKQKGIFPCKAIFEDGELGLAELHNDSVRLTSLISTTLSTKRPFTLQLLMPLDWRFLLVRKTIHIYYVSKRTNEATFLTHHNATLIYQQVFLNSSDAVDYFKRIATKQKPGNLLLEHIAESFKKSNWTEMAQDILTWCFKDKEPNSIDLKNMERLLFAWRLFHSPGGSLMYAIAVSEALAESVMHMDSFSKDKTKQKLVVSMLYGFRNYVDKILSSKSTMVSSALNPYCQESLQISSPCNLVDGTASIDAIKLSTALLHVKGILVAAVDNLVSNLIQCTPSLNSILDD